ncbi:MAG: HEAT repeat domain-containing protein, partial [Planctomycetia bacterium]|nr:HEAT repeat domain-containing protein [Planctomycetia bacterium]
GFDPATDLLVLDEPDAERPDAMPAAWLGKLRYVIVAPKGRAGDLAAWRDGAAARAGEALAADLAPLAHDDPARAAELVAARAGPGQERPLLTFYQGLATYLAGSAARDAARRGVAGTLLRRSSAAAPVLAVERFVRTTESSWSRDEADTAAADLALIEADEGPCAWVHAGRFVVYEAARRHAEALASIVEARALDPFDVRTLYFRGNLRRLLGDALGAREDLVRVLDRRPDTLAAAEDLVALHLEAGAPDRALAVVEALVAADPASASSKPVRQLRQRTEVRVVRRARTAADLASLARSPEPDTRKEVAWTAASFETPEAEALLRALLEDADEGVRRKAAQAYQRPWLVDLAAADPRLFDALAARLAGDPVPTVREALALALAREETARADAVLAPRLAGPSRDPDVGVRAAIADALTGRETPDVRRGLVAALEDPESVVRATALRGLVRLAGSARGFEPDGAPDQRAAAVRAWQAWLSGAR